MKPIQSDLEGIAEAIRSAAAARGHTVKGHYCEDPNCAGCKLVRATREPNAKPPPRSRIPGEDDDA